MKGLKHITLTIITASILAGTTLFGFATPVNAGIAECLTGILSGKAIATISGLTGGIRAVPVNSRAANSITGNISGQTQGSTVTRCIVEPIVTMIARTILDKFTAETVRWINSGFQGDPLYVTNLDGFLADTADEVIGRFIYSLGPIGEILCSPFDLQLRLALSLQYRSPDFYRQIGCRLSDIEQNVQRAFTKAGGSFGQDGWSNWLKLTAVPQNNPYGGYLTAVETLDLEIAGRHNIELTQASWGKGFLSSKKCAVNMDDYDEETGEVYSYCAKWVTETPGTLIEDQLSTTLGVQVQKVGLAKDIDAIIDALIGQLINQILGPGGLLASTQSREGGKSAADRALASTVAKINAANNQTLPTGIKPANQTDESFCDEFSKGVFSTPKPPPPRTDATPVYIKTGDAFNRQVTNGNYNWTVADYRAVSTFCKILPNSKFIKSGVGDFNAASDALTNIPDASDQDNQDKNIQLQNATANQSSTLPPPSGQSRLPQNALLGGGFLLSATKGGQPNWWSVLLNQEERISAIEITPLVEYDCASVDSMTIKIQKVVTGSEPVDAPNEWHYKINQADKSQGVVTKIITGAGGVLGNRVVISTDSSLYLCLYKVKLERYLLPTISVDADAQAIIE